MKKNKIVLTIALLVVLAMLIFLGMKIYKYHHARKLCDDIKAGKEIETEFSNGSTAPLFLDDVAAILQIDGPKIPLVEACYYRNVQAVKTLLANGADPNFFIKGRWSPLEAVFVYGPIDDRCFEIVKLLVEHGCDVNLHASEKPVVISLAGKSHVDKRNQEILLYLLDHGASKTHEGYEKIFFLTIISGNTELTDILIKQYGFDVNRKGFDEKTPLMVASEYLEGEALDNMRQILLSNGALQ